MMRLRSHQFTLLGKVLHVNMLLLKEGFNADVIGWGGGGGAELAL